MQQDHIIESSTQELINLWQETYNSTLGRITEMPGVGPYRERSERMMKGFNLFVELWTSWLDSSIDMQEVSMEALKETSEKIIDETKGEMQALNYKDIYRIWVETYSNAFKEFLNSGHFGEDQGRLVSAMIDFQTYQRQMMEENFLRPMSLPTKNEMDEANKEIFELKKHLNEMKSEKIRERQEGLSRRKEMEAATGEMQKEIRELKKQIKAQETKVKQLSEVKKELSTLKREVAKASPKPKPGK